MLKIGTINCPKWNSLFVCFSNFFGKYAEYIYYECANIQLSLRFEHLLVTFYFQIYGNGKQTRSFQYVSDLVNGLIALMESDVDSPVNLGNPEELTIQEFAELIKKMTSSSSKIINKAAATDDPRKRKPDITKAKTLIHWEPVVPLNEGLNSTIAYFKAELLQKSENKRNVFLPPKEHIL